MVLSAEAYYLKGGRINSTLCKSCTREDNKLRRQNPEEHRRVKAARIEARGLVQETKNSAVTEKQCSKCSELKLLEEFRVHKGLYGRSSWCRKCERKYTREWTEENRDTHNAKQRETWSKKEFTPEERAEAASRSREWYAENKERHHQNFYRWARENNQARNSMMQKRRAQKAGAGELTLTPKGWLEILDYFNRSCAYCLSTSEELGEELTMDHVIPLSRGGQHTADNVVPACRSCNSKKGPRSILTMLSA